MKGGQTSAASSSRNCHMAVMPAVTSRAPGGLSLPLSGQKIPACNLFLLLSHFTFQLLPRMPLMGEPPFPRCKCMQKTPADELPPALPACQSTPERVRLHGPPHRAAGENKQPKPPVSQELEAFPPWAAGPSRGCCSSRPLFYREQVLVRMPRAKLEGGITEFCMAIRTLSVRQHTAGKLQVQSRPTELLLGLLMQSNH